MSGVCGRRRLAKLAFVIGVVSGKFTGSFLQKEPKDIDRPKDSRTTESSALHDAAFLEVQVNPNCQISFGGRQIGAEALHAILKDGRAGLEKFRESSAKLLKSNGGTAADNVRALIQAARKLREEPKSAIAKITFEALEEKFVDAGLDFAVKHVKTSVLGHDFPDEELVAMARSLKCIRCFLSTEEELTGNHFAEDAEAFDSFLLALLER